jgi:hypothetical protein
LSSRPSSIWNSGVRSVGLLPGGVVEFGCGQSVPQMIRSELAAISAWASGITSA